MLQLPARAPKRFALLGLAAFFVGAGTNHFVNPDFYVAMMPPYLPAHLELVYLSGVLEIAGGVAVLSSTIRAWVGWALILLLIAVFPANVHMAINPDSFPDIGRASLYARLPVQLLFVVWVRRATRPDAQPVVEGNSL